MNIRIKSVMIAVAAALMVVAPSLWGQSRFRVLHSFTGGADGGGVWQRVAVDKNGDLYGTTSGGGEYGYGTVFQVRRGGNDHWTESVLHSFMLNDPDGAEPEATLLIDSAGSLYGAAPNGGAFGRGTIFELSPRVGAWSINVLHSFCMQSGCPDGSAPFSGLIMDNGGNLFGIAFLAFELTPGIGGWSEKVLYPFCVNLNCNPQDGNFPDGKLLSDAAGNLYGTTLLGGDPACGNDGCGTVYELTPNLDGTWNERVIYSFGQFTNDGQDPSVEQLTIDTAGNLYGTTQSGGSHTCFGEGGCGTVFKLTLEPNGEWKETILYNFTGGTDGATPEGGLLIQNGSLYGFEQSSHGWPKSWL